MVVLLSGAGLVVTTLAISEDREHAAHRRADVLAREVQGQLEHVSAFAVGLGNALQGEHAPNGRRFAALAGSASTTVGLTVALWVERVAQNGRRKYERRIAGPITELPGRQVAGPAATYLPATFVTGVTVRPGTDMERVPGLAATLEDPTSVFAGTATPIASLAGQRGFFVVEGGQFGQGLGSQGFLVVFVRADWLSLVLNLDPHRAAISLDGRPVSGALSGAPAAGQSFEALTQRWRVAVAAEPPSALQTTLPWLAIAFPPATALLIWLLGRGMLRRRRAERQVDDIFDLSPDVLCVAGFDGYFKRLNPAFEHMLGYEADQLLSRPFLDFVHPDDREPTAKLFGALDRVRHVSDFENRYVRADGAVRWLQWNVRAMTETGLIYAAARDVTANRILTYEQAALRRVATLVAEGHDAGQLFYAVAVEVGQLLSADATRLLRYQEDGSASVVGSYGIPDAEIESVSRVMEDSGQVWGRIARSRVSERTDGLREGSGALAESLLAAGITAVVAVPIVVSGQPWGAIVAAWKYRDMAGGDTEIRMRQFTELVATAVANAESSAELAASRARIVAAADEERRRIERDLHDGAQQRLVHAVIVLKLALRAVLNGEARASELVEEALQHAEQANAELRELAHGILPSVLTRGGLRAGVKALVSRVSLPVSVDVSVGRLPAGLEATAYFVVSEALANVVKHAGAETAAVAVRIEGGAVRVEVHDDGTGGADPSLGSGLIGLRDRVAALGGMLTVWSEPGAGTVLTAQIPVSAPAREAAGT